MNQTDRPEIPHLLGSRLLQKQGDEHVINCSKSMTIKERQGIERCHDVHLNDILANNEEVG
jgi:hypothetical protein